MEGADITCEAEYGRSTVGINKNKRKTEIKEVVEEVTRKEKEKVFLFEIIAYFEEAYGVTGEDLLRSIPCVRV